jgi:hypothetical protein
MFTLLDRFDLAAAHAWQRVDPKDWRMLTDIVEATPLAFAQFNSGVILYRRTSEVKQLLAEWARLIDRNLELGTARGLPRATDQTALREAIYASTLRVATLPPEYNCRAGYLGYLEGQVKILHGRRFDPARTAAELNRAVDERTFINLPRGVQVWLRHDADGRGRSALGRLRMRLALLALETLRPRR